MPYGSNIGEHDGECPVLFALMLTVSASDFQQYAISFFYGTGKVSD
jgi:hypothetical protein